MPELPEVEAVARALRPFVAGRTIRRCRVVHAIAVRPSSGRGEAQARKQLECVLRGRRILRVERRGKYLLLALDKGYVALHFRLDGHLVWSDTRGINGHIDVAFEFDHGALGFVDRRHFGRVQWLVAAEELTGIRQLGVDPLSPQFTPARLFELVRASRRPLKLFLLDQSRIAGLGNIYSSEALWHARLNPKRRAHRVTPTEARRLHKAIVAVLRRALECCLNPAPDFRDADWWFQGLENILRVYGREGKACRRCSRPVRRIEQGGRSTFFCARCQR
jgi:formamidopyrimidine-DNA glycosylase